MKLKDSIKTAYKGVLHAKVRSILTMLGIVIGIASVILLMSIGSSAQNLILDQIKSIGSNLVFIIPGGNGGSKFASPASVQGIIIKTLNKTDLDSLSREPEIDQVTAEARGQAKIIFENNDKRVTYSSVNEKFFSIENFTLKQGRAFTQSEVASFSRVAVIGSEIAKTLFGERNPVDKVVRLKDISFRIIGVLDSKGVGPFGVDQDNLVIIPITVGQKQMLGIDYYNQITIQAKDNYNIDYIKSRITSILRENHRINDPSKDDFTIRTQADALAILGNITSILKLFLTAIASISLIVGGIGIMNIMLVSVVERTKEIGLRKALGATNKDILQQFLIESIILTSIGGLVGILSGTFLTLLIYLGISYFLSTWTFSLPLSAVLLAVAVSTITGVAFGIYPARQASRKNPIDTLRYE